MISKGCMGDDALQVEGGILTFVYPPPPPPLAGTNASEGIQCGFNGVGRLMGLDRMACQVLMLLGLRNEKACAKYERRNAMQ